MKSIAALEVDMLAQAPALGGFVPQEPLDSDVLRDSIFCGSGDSLAACMLAEAFSGYNARAADPLDLVRARQIPADANLYAISISGRTVSNIKAARLARYSTAITANPKSRLAVVSDAVIPLTFPNSDVVTAGSISFLESALTCISLVRRLRLRGARGAFERAEAAAHEIRLEGHVFILGNIYTYPIAMYAAAKMYEILGHGAQYERIEQFSHMGLFSVKDGDTVLIFEKKTAYNTTLLRHLEEAGLNAVRPDPGSSDGITQFLFYTFLAQILSLREARKRRLTECHFMTAKVLKDASDAMIY